VYVVEPAGVTEREPEDETTPTPSIEMVSALVVFHVSSVDCPWLITFGLAANVAVGTAGGGGDGGTTLATFLLHAPSNKRTAVMLANRKLSTALRMVVYSSMKDRFCLTWWLQRDLAMFRPTLSVNRDGRCWWSELNAGDQQRKIQVCGEESPRKDADINGIHLKNHIDGIENRTRLNAAVVSAECALTALRIA